MKLAPNWIMMSKSRHGNFYIITERVAEEDKFCWTTYHHEDGEYRVFHLYYSDSRPSWELTSYA
jgi:hypothetical protein